MSIFRSRNINMTEGKPLKLMLAFSVPLMFGNVFQQFYTVTDTAIIGLLLSSSANQRVIKSSQISIFQHDGFSWEVSRNRFLPAELSEISRLIEKSLSDWLNQMSEKDRRSFTEIIFSLFESTGAESFSKISQQKLKSADAILNAMRKMPKEKQQEILSFLQQLGLSGGNALAAYLSSKIRKEH